MRQLSGLLWHLFPLRGLKQGSLWQVSGAVAAIALARTFAIGLAIYAAALLAGRSGPEAISYTLLGSYKNLGLAASVSLTLFGQQASLPAAFSVLAETAFFPLAQYDKTAPAVTTLANKTHLRKEEGIFCPAPDDFK